MNNVLKNLGGGLNLGAVLELGKEKENPKKCYFHVEGTESFVLKALGKN